MVEKICGQGEDGRRSMHAISSYRGNRPTNKHANTQTGPITIHFAAKLIALCNNTVLTVHLLMQNLLFN